MPSGPTPSASLVWHHPEAISIEKFEDGLLRQNGLVHDNWRVYRWTDRQLAQHAEQVKEQLILFLGAVPGLLAINDFLRTADHDHAAPRKRAVASFPSPPGLSVLAHRFAGQLSKTVKTGGLKRTASIFRISGGNSTR